MQPPSPLRGRKQTTANTQTSTSLRRVCLQLPCKRSINFSAEREDFDFAFSFLLSYIISKSRFIPLFLKVVNQLKLEKGFFVIRLILENMSFNAHYLHY